MDFKIKKINESTIKLLDTTPETDLEVSEAYTYKIPNFAAMRKNARYKNWNGKVNLYNRTTKSLDYGHWFDLYTDFTKRGYDIELDESLIPDKKLDKEELVKIIDEHIQPRNDSGDLIVPYDYQIDAIHHAIDTDRSVILSATSSGKSLIIYCLCWLYINCILEDYDGYITIIVPDKGLVEQMYSDFHTYSNGESDNWCQKLNSDYSKIITKKVVISTFQTMIKMDDLIDEASVMIVDEVHRSKAKQLKTILQLAKQAKYKHGLTGTLDGVEANETLIKGLFGNVVRFVTQRELIDSGRACDVVVNIIGLRYPKDLVDQYNEEWEFSKQTSPHIDKYQFEVDFINNCKERNDMLLDIVEMAEGNSFVLFNRVESHGLRLYEQYKEKHPDSTYLITGDIKNRKDVLDTFKKDSNSVLFATSSIMSTGVSVNNLHNLFFAASQKAKVATLQSIGRLMRLHDSKSVANVYDIVDIIGKNNVTQKHVDERIKHYESEQIKYTVTIVDI